MPSMTFIFYNMTDNCVVSYEGEKSAVFHIGSPFRIRTRSQTADGLIFP